MKNNLYKTVGVDKKATPKEIKEAFKKKAKELHPDKATGDNAKMTELNHAYQILSDPLKRDRYDTTGDDGPEKSFEVKFHMVMNSFLIQIVTQVEDIEYKDMIRILSDQLSMNLEKLNKEKEQTENIVRKFNSTKERIIATENQTLIRVLEDNIEVNNTKILQMKEEVKFLERCIETVDTYNYRVDKKEESKVGWVHFGDTDNKFFEDLVNRTRDSRGI